MTDIVTVDEVVGRAVAETGLDDLGDPACCEGLTVLLDCVAREAELNDIGRMILRTWVHERLVNRLRVVDWVRAHPWMRGARISLAVTNLFNQRQRVRDADGTTPVSYQPGYLDPLGRSVRLSVRKLFF